MKKIFTSELLPKSSFLCSLREKKHSKNIYLIVFLVFVFSSSLSAQSASIKDALDTYKKNFYLWKEPEAKQPATDSVLTVLGRWAWGPCLVADIKGNFVYIGNGPTFHVLDIHDPSNPEIYGEYLTDGFIYDIEVRDNIAFVCTGNGFLILDVTDPSTPNKLSFVDMGAGYLALEDSFAYVTDFSAVRVVDISDLNNPFLRGGISAGGEFVACVEAKDGYVYVGNAEWPELEIVDATNPDTLSAVFFGIGGYCLSAFIKDTLLFAGVSYLSSTQFKIYSISNLAEPEFIGQIEMADSTFNIGITVSEDGQNAYVISIPWTPGNEAIYSIDISNLSQPEILDKYEIATQSGGSGISLSNKTLTAAYSSGLCVLDISNPGDLQLKSFFPTGWFAEKIRLKDSLAFVASGLAGLWILDVTNPSKPKAVSNVNTNSFTSDLVVEDSLVYIVNCAIYSREDSSRGLWIIDISDLYQPTILSHYIGIVRFPDGIIHQNSIAKRDSLILISQSGGAVNDTTLEIINVSNPLSPARTGIFQTSFYPYDVCASDSIIYLATAEGGLRIIDISEPNYPVEIGNILNNTFSVTIDEHYVYTSTSTFSIINADDPANPYLVSSLQTHGSSGDADLFVSENYAYWADWELGVIDISNPENPIQITLFDGKDRGRGVAVEENKIFFADQTQGVWILRNNLISDVKNEMPVVYDYKLYQNYPNPFNPSTTIKFEIPKSGLVTLKIYNILGEEIETLVNEERLSGRYEVNFDASKLASGVFIYRLSVNDLSAGSGQSFVNVKKMIFIK